MQHRRICARIRTTRSADRSFGLVKWKLETHKHFFNRRTTGAQLWAPVRGLPFQPELGLALQNFTSEGFLLKNFQSNSPSTPDRTRKPDQESEEVLASVWFYTNKQLNNYLFSLFDLARSQSYRVLPEYLNYSQHLGQSWDPQYRLKPSTGTQRSKQTFRVLPGLEPEHWYVLCLLVVPIADFKSKKIFTAFALHFTPM